MFTDLEVTYIDHMGSDLTVVNSARVSYGKRIEAMSDKDEKLIKYLAEHKHFTPFEHCTITVLIKCPMYIRSQIHRHRTFSYNEISRRYTEENIEFYAPKSWRKQHQKSKQCSDGQADNQPALTGLFHRTVIDAYSAYNELIADGVAREQARAVLPQCLQTQFYMTGNLRNWAHFLSLRMDSHAQEEVREIALNIYNILLKLYPASLKHLL